MDKSTIKNIALIAPVLYLYQNIFLWYKNVSMFTTFQFMYSFGAILIISILCYVIFYSLFSILFSKLQNLNLVKLSIGIFVGVFIGIISNLFFLRTLFYPYHHIVMYGVMIGVVLIVYFNVVNYFIKFSYILLFIAICSFSYNFYRNTIVVFEDTDKYLVEFKDKPNIYMIWVESFHGTRTLKDVYNVDISPFTAFLEDNNFTVCENIYSSGSYTLASMTDLYSLGAVNPNNYKFGRADAMVAIRKLLAGGNGNNLLKVLKYNGYFTNMLVGGSIYFTFKEKNLDYASIDLYDKNMLYLFPCYAFSKFSKLSPMPVYILGLRMSFFEKELESQIDKMQKMKQPYFISIKYEGMQHTAWTPYSYKKRTEWIASGKYKHNAEESIPDLQKLISIILKKDHDALIVMLGDHGAFTYRYLPYEKAFFNSDEFNTVFTDDIFNVYGAVRLPEKYAKFSFNDNSGSYINHQNIFVHIISLLAQNPEYLKLQEIPVSRLLPEFISTNKDVKDVVVNGILNKEFFNVK